MIALQSWYFDSQWEFGYEIGRMGQWLVQARGFSVNGESPSAQFPPFYPLIVAGIFSVFGVYSQASAIAIFVFQSACSGVIAVCLGISGNRLFGRETGLFASALWAFYPISIFYFSVRQIWYSEFSIMLLLLAVTVAVTAGPILSWGRVALLGGLTGLVGLTDSVMGPYLALLALWLVWTRGKTLPRLIGALALWGVLVGTVMSPWILRNLLVMGTPYLTKSNFGLELFRGNHSFSSGAHENRHETEAQALALLDQGELAYYQGQPDAVYFAYLQQKAVEWIRRHPGEFFRLTMKRVYLFWVWIPHTRNAERHLLFYGPLVILALFGLWIGLRQGRHVAPLWLFFLVYPLPYYLTHVGHYRYRYPVEPFVVLLAAVSLAVWSRRQSVSRSGEVIEAQRCSTAGEEESSLRLRLGLRFSRLHAQFV